MNLLRLLLLLQLATPLALGQAVGNSEPASLPNKPEALVRSLYQKVVVLHPLGIGDTRFFAPYLSKALLHRIDVNSDCQRDWDRQNPDPNAKPPFLEFGLFTGDDERVEPTAFHIEKVQAEKDGSIRVYVKLIRDFPDSPGESPEIWNVAAILVREKGHLAVNDVIWLKDNPQDVDVPLSEYLALGCDGPHWVGFKEPQGDQKQQR